jgi:hypothetical protein
MVVSFVLARVDLVPPDSGQASAAGIAGRGPASRSRVQSRNASTKSGMLELGVMEGDDRRAIVDRALL